MSHIIQCSNIGSVRRSNHLALYKYGYLKGEFIIVQFDRVGKQLNFEMCI